MSTRPTGYWHRAIRGGLSFLTDQVLTSGQQAQARENIGAAGLLNTQTLLFRLTGANMNVTTDQAFTKIHGFNSFMLTGFFATNASISLTTAVGGIYTGASKGGVVIISNTAAYSGLVSAAVGTAVTPFPATGRGVLAGSTSLYLSLTTPQGAAATADFYAIGFGIS